MWTSGRHIDVNGCAFHVREAGDPRGRLVVCIPGLSSTSMSYSALADRITGSGIRLVAVDLRGRGRTPAGGIYGWPAHAKDIAALAATLTREPFDIVGHAMGAYVGMVVASLTRLGRLVLIDGLGRPDDGARHRALQVASRLGSVHCSADAYIDSIAEHRRIDALWEAHYREELAPAPGGVLSRTSREACFEDAAYGASHDAGAFWGKLPERVLVVRATSPGETGAHAIPVDDLKRFLKTHPKARAVEVDTDHYGLMSQSAALNAIAEYLS